MPKLKPTSMFSKRNMAILVTGDTENKTPGVPGPSSVIMPIVDEFREFGVRGNIKVVSANSSSAPSGGILNMMHDVLVSESPTIIETPDFNNYEKTPINDMLIGYAKMLVMATGGFVVRVCQRKQTEPIAKTNCPLPTINYDISRDSWMDIQEKVRSLAAVSLSPDVLDYYLMLNSFSKIVKNSMGCVFLGDVSRSYINPASVAEENKLMAVAMLSGSSQNPISPMEFSKKVWGSESLKRIGADNLVVVRKESPCAKIILGKLLSEPRLVANDFKVVEL